MLEIIIPVNYVIVKALCSPDMCKPSRSSFREWIFQKSWLQVNVSSC